MKRLLVTLFVLSITGGCGDATEPETGEDFVGSSPAEALASAKAVADSKQDQTVTCGEDSCSPFLCGYDCSTQGSQCKKACAEADTRPDTFVKLSVSGSESVTLDSTAVGYNPILRLEDVLIFGCEHWDFSSQTKDGFEIKYTEAVDAGFTAGQSEIIGNKANIYVAPFEGPGSYQATAYYKSSSTADRYFYSEECGVEVSVADDGTISGDVNCGSIPAVDGARGSVRISGEFSCGMNALNPIFTDLTP